MSHHSEGVKGMKLIINGTAQSVECQFLGELVEHYKLNREHVVAEVDGEIIDRSEWDRYPLKDGARIELVHFVGGG